MQSAIFNALRRQTKRQSQGVLRKVQGNPLRPHPSSPVEFLVHHGEDRQLYHTSARWWHRGSTINSAAAHPAAQFAVIDPSDEYEAEEDEFHDLERMAREHMSAHITPREMRSLTSLDLELGEDTVWDADDYDENDDIIEEDIGRWDRSTEQHEPSEYVGPYRAQSTDSTAKQKKTVGELLTYFDPENAPESDDLESLQLWLECQAHSESLLKYQKILDDARHRKDYASLSIFQKQVLRWFPLLRDDIARMQSEYMLKKSESPQKCAKRYGPYLCTVSPEKLAVITAHEVLLLCLTKQGTSLKPGVPFLNVAKRLGEAVEQEVLIHRLLHQRSLELRERAKKRSESEKASAAQDDCDSSEESGSNESESHSFEDVDVFDDSGRSADNDELKVDGAPANWTYAASHLNGFLGELSRNDLSSKKKRVVQYALTRARQVLDRDEWAITDRIGLGAALFHSLLENAQVSVDGHDVPAFSYEKRWVSNEKLQSVVILNETLSDRIISDKVSSFSSLTTRYKPMILPPKPWKGAEDGGYHWLKAELMRSHGCNVQKDALEDADMSTLYHGLNVLGRVPWKINKRILETAWQCWDQNIALGDIPTRTDFEVPPEPIAPPPMPAGMDRESPGYETMLAERKKYQDAMHKYRRFRQKNMDLRSLRCSAMLKLDQADKFKEFEEIYFPYVSCRV